MRLDSSWGLPAAIDTTATEQSSAAAAIRLPAHAQRTPTRHYPSSRPQSKLRRAQRGADTSAPGPGHSTRTRACGGVGRVDSHASGGRTRPHWRHGACCADTNHTCPWWVRSATGKHGDASHTISLPAPPLQRLVDVTRVEEQHLPALSSGCNHVTGGTPSHAKQGDALGH